MSLGCFEAVHEWVSQSFPPFRPSVSPIYGVLSNILLVLALYILNMYELVVVGEYSLIF